MLHFAVCPVCGKENTLVLSREQEKRFSSIDPNSTEDVRGVLPELTGAQAALLYSGLCDRHYREG